jgi:hypothetical protein
MQPRPERRAGRQRLQKAADTVGQLRIAGQRGHLFLPQIDEPLGERGQIGAVRVAFGLHAAHHSRGPVTKKAVAARFRIAV